MKFTSIVLASVLSAAFFAGCATGPARLVYKESQFDNQLEYLQFLPALRDV